MVVLKGGCAFWVLLIAESARASHLLHWAVFYRFGFRLLVRALVLRTLLYLSFVYRFGFRFWFGRLSFALA